MGRKTRYNRSLCDKLPAMFDDGESVAEVCKKLGVVKQTFYNWVEKYPAFKKAYEEGLFRSEAWWMELGRNGAAGKEKINPATWIFNMKNRFGWKDRTEHTGHNDGPMTHLTSVTYTGVESDGRRTR